MAARRISIAEPWSLCYMPTLKGSANLPSRCIVRQSMLLGLIAIKLTWPSSPLSLADVFHDLRNPEKKSDIFRHSLPDDRKLHLFAKEREFVQRSAEFMRRTVEIPDAAVDMESNLTPTVLSKNLFRLGFRHDAFEQFNGDINKLLEFRNKIGHGEIRVGIVKRTYDDIRTSVDKVMTGITIVVMRALEQGEYLREEEFVPSSAAATI